MRDADAFKVAYFQDEFHFCRNRFGFVNEVGRRPRLHPRPPRGHRSGLGPLHPRATARVQLSGLCGQRDGRGGRALSRCPMQSATSTLATAGGPCSRSWAPVAREGLIGERFRELAAGTGLRVDIDTSEGGRIYGDRWYRFLGGVGRCSASSRAPHTSISRTRSTPTTGAPCRWPAGHARGAAGGAARTLGPQLLLPHDQPAPLRGGGVPHLPGVVRGGVLRRSEADGPLPAAQEGLLELRGGRDPAPRRWRCGARSPTTPTETSSRSGAIPTRHWSGSSTSTSWRRG